MNDLGNGVYELTLARPITPGAATVITYLNDDSYVTYIAHPANADGSTYANAADITFVVDCWRNPGSCTEYQADIDRSGQVTGNDVIVLVDLLNGMDQFDEWFFTLKADPGPCEPVPVPCGCGALLCGAPEGGGASGPEEDGARFAEGFVAYLTNVDLEDEEQAEWFGEIVARLCDLSVRALSAGERANLAASLLDPELTFVSPWVEFLVPDISAFLQSFDLSAGLE